MKRLPARLAASILFSACFFIYLFSANIRAKIFSADGLPLTGAEIYSSANHTIAYSGKDGGFSLSVPDDNSEIIISFPGYVSRQISISETTSGAIYLDRKVVTGNETVIQSTYKSLINKTVKTTPIVISGDVNTISLEKELNNLSGIEIIQYGDPNSPAYISLNGADPKQVLILLNGTPIRDLKSGTTDISSIPVSIIERVEITQGSASSVYGEGALGGAVNIVTRKADNTPGNVSISCGKYNSIQVDATGSFQTSYFDSFTGIRGYYSDGNYKFNYPNPDGTAGNIYLRRKNNRSDIFSFYNSLSTKFLGSSTDLYSNMECKDKQLPGNINQLNYFLNAAQEIFSLSETLKQRIPVTSLLLLDIELFYNYTKSSYKNPVGNFYKTDQKSDTKLLGGKINISYDYFGYGAEVKEEALDEDIFYPAHLNNHHKRLVFSQTLYASDINIFKWDEIEAKYNVSFRANFSSLDDADVRTDYSFSNLVSCLLSSSYSIDLSYNQAIRYPEFASLFWIGDAFAIGNPNLKSEKSRSFQLSANYKGDILRYEVSYYYSIYNDWINWQESAGGKWKPFNNSRMRFYGINSSLGLNYGILEYELNINWLRSKDYNNVVEVVPYKPELRVRNKFRFEIEDYSLELSVSSTSKRYYNKFNKEKYLSTYQKADMLFTYRLSDYINSSFSISNIFDTVYQQRANVPMPGRTFELSLSYSF